MRPGQTAHEVAKHAGHSQGASVAEICALDLLFHAARKGNSRKLALKVVGFAAPAIGNQALADFVKQHGWHQYMTNYILPGRFDVRYLSYISRTTLGRSLYMQPQLPHQNMEPFLAHSADCMCGMNEPCIAD